MRDTRFSRRDMLRTAGALTVGAAFAEPLKAPAAEPAGAGPEPTQQERAPEVSAAMIDFIRSL
jgi:hypothetical protein